METSSSVDALFPCNWQGCSRSYRRQDHLERHQRSHLGDNGFVCRICDKEYSRSDVLARHMAQSHNEKPSRVGRPRKIACVACVDARMACDGAPPRSCPRCLTSKIKCRYRHLTGHSRSASPTRTLLSPCLADPSDAASASNSIMPAMPGLQGEGSVVSDNLPKDGTIQGDQGDEWPSTGPFEESDWLTDLFVSATTQNSDSALFPTSATSLGHPPFDWGFSDLEANIFDPIGYGQAWSDVIGDLDAVSRVPARDADLVQAVNAEEIDGQTEVTEMPDGGPGENSWPNVYKPDTPDCDVSLPKTRAPSPGVQQELAPSLFAHASAASVNAGARDVMQSLARHAHQPIWPLPDLHTFPSARTLTACINLYLANFSPWLPIVDSPKGSFRIDKAAPILLKAMAAVGSVFRKDDLGKLGNPLNELVRREIVFTCEHDQRFVFEPCVVQASLLQSCFSLYSGSPRMFQQAEVTRGSLVSACRRMHLLHSGVSAVAELGKRMTCPTTKEQYLAIRQDHRRRRLGWSIFIFDAQLACLFGLPAQLPLCEVASPLPTAAPDAAANQASFKDIMECLLSGGKVSAAIEDMGLCCIAYALYRLCLDVSPLERLFPGQGSAEYRYPNGTPYSFPQILLDRLASYALETSALPSPLLVCVPALANHAHMQFTTPGILDRIKTAAGRYDAIDSREEARQQLTAWASDCAKDARLVFAHATRLNCLLNRFTFDTPTEVVWTFDSALCMWAYLIFSPSRTSTPGKTITISWSSSALLEQWVETGDGMITIQGLAGSASGLTAREVVRHSSDRLEVMSWGLAARYREVLQDLLLEIP